ncbi:mannitol dehydrogenase family protein [SAR92 clade bacterium H231]|nr:mannitol dehydrogenase family protein [SAR92 clade bacterium H231]
MQQLTAANLKQLLDDPENRSPSIDGVPYDRNAIQPSVVHFGVGNFHRCHQAVYMDRLLRQGFDSWGIIGISMRSTKTRDVLESQDFLYTEVTLGGQASFRIIGSILDILVAPEDPDAVVKLVAKQTTKLVTTTITEKGYYLSSGNIDYSHTDMSADEASLERPQTIYGYLAAGIILRSVSDAGPLSIVCCDNIDAGGQKMRAGVFALLKIHSPHLEDWADKNISFASSMVDKVAPTTDDSLRALVDSTLNIKDAWPVSAEPFSQWIIEDKFAGPRPPLDEVGVIFSGDIIKHQQMKLRFLNASHSIIAVLAHLTGHKNIHDALEHPPIFRFVGRVLREAILPVTDVPEGFEGSQYIIDIIQRFQNSALPYSAQQVNTDSSQKINLRWFPTIEDALMKSNDTTLMSFMIAAWIVYIEKALEDYTLNDPLHAELFKIHQNGSSNIEQFLKAIGADKFSFMDSSSFMAAVTRAYETLSDNDVSIAITDVLNETDLPSKSSKDLYYA